MKTRIRKAQPITLDAKGRDGKVQRVKLRAKVIEGPVVKADDSSDPNLATSQVEEEEFNRLLSSRSTELIEPPFNLSKMIATRQISSELGEAIDAMVTNTVGFGYRLRQRRMSDEQKAALGALIEDEHLALSAELETMHPSISLTEIMRRAKADKHLCGNGYVELIFDGSDRPVAANHVHGHTVRLSVKDRKPTRVEVPVVRPDRNFAVITKAMSYRFRRFVQMRNNKLIWFKEAGDPRQLDAKTGEFVTGRLPPSRRANALLHFAVYNAISPYGVPNWIGEILSIHGNRSAAETNYVTLEHHAIPSMFVIVENGELTDASIERLRQYVEGQIQGTANRSRFIILEGESLDEGAPTPQQFRIRIEPLKQIQHSEELFQSYRGNNNDAIRQSFRLPPLFSGRADDYNRATAEASRSVADEQVFAPDRSADDFAINRFVVLPLGGRFHVYRSNNPNITDDTELIRLMGIAEKSGGMTPRRADQIVRDVFGEDIGPLPKGIDLDIPFSISFAAAQQGMRNGDQEDEEDEAEKILSGLLNLRRSIETELDSRLKKAA